MYTCGNTSKSRKTRFPSVDTPAKMPDSIIHAARACERRRTNVQDRYVHPPDAPSGHALQARFEHRYTRKNTDFRPPYPAAHVNMLELLEKQSRRAARVTKNLQIDKIQKKYLKKFFTCVNIVSSVSRSGEIGRRSRLKICRSSLCVSVRVRPSAPLFEKTSSPRSFLFSQNGENVSLRRIFSLCMPEIFVPVLFNRGF